VRENGTQSLIASVKIDGINPYVVVPAATVAALGSDPRQPVLLRLRRESRERRPRAGPIGRTVARDAARLIAIGRLTPDHWFRTRLVRQRSGVRIYLDTWMREEAGIAVGDRVEFTLKPDTGPRALTVPTALQEALEVDAQALAAWNALAPSRQREILAYLNFLKTPAAVERNVRKVIGQLRGSL
jgi:hypothetical protein